MEESGESKQVLKDVVEKVRELGLEEVVRSSPIVGHFHPPPSATNIFHPFELPFDTSFCGFHLLEQGLPPRDADPMSMLIPALGDSRGELEMKKRRLATLLNADRRPRSNSVKAIIAKHQHKIIERFDKANQLYEEHHQQPHPQPSTSQRNLAGGEDLGGRSKGTFRCNQCSPPHTFATKKDLLLHLVTLSGVAHV